MKIVLLGKDGQVGWELQRSLAPLGELLAFDRTEADLENSDALRSRIVAVRPDIIVNAAAYTAVDRAESEPEKAHQINAEAPAVLARYAADSGAWLIHYSTDYVFDGRRSGFYEENETTAPLSVYGRTKRDGEAAIIASGCRHLIFRTSWVFASRGGNFAKTMLRLATERDRLAVVNDQFGAPTSAELIADVTALCLYRLMDHQKAPSLSGLYHLVAAGETTWFDFACLVLKEAQAMGVVLKVPPESVLPIPSSEYPTPAVRPANSRLSTQKLQSAFSICLPDWQVHVRRMLWETLAK